ncbi:MAG: hypothetical protein AAFN07_12535 [Pseudomonadota bacterium]
MSLMPWHATIASRLERQFSDDHLGHALLLQGPKGIGKQGLAAWLAGTILGIDSALMDDRLDEVSPDLIVVSPEEKKHTISVNQIRGLSEKLTLSSHGPNGMVTIIEPAEQMTIAAANALLKTLEEPVDQRWIILVTHDAARLPATVLSRCERITAAIPAFDDAATWLVSRGLDPADAEQALHWTGGSPLQALALHEAGQIQALARLRSDLQGLLGGRGSALQVATVAESLGFERSLETIRSVAIEAIRAESGVEVGAASSFSGYVIDLPGLFCYLESLNRATRLQPGSFNAELMLETLLIPWATGFRPAT